MSLRLSPVGEPTGEWGLPEVRKRVIDRVEVQVHGDVDSLGNIWDAEVEVAYLDAAIGACNAVLDHCRAVGRAPFVNGVRRERRIQDGRTYLLTPHTVTWLHGETGRPLDLPLGNARGNAGALGSPERGSVSWAAVMDSLSTGQEPNLAVSLLVDARERLLTLRLREAVVAMATAVEIATDKYATTRAGSNAEDVLHRIWQGRRVQNRMTLSFAVKRLDILPLHLSERSLKREDRTTFDAIQSLYRARNNAAHEGRLYYEHAGSQVAVDAQMVADFLTHAERAVEWVTSL